MADENIDRFEQPVEGVRLIKKEDFQKELEEEKIREQHEVKS